MGLRLKRTVQAGNKAHTYNSPHLTYSTISSSVRRYQPVLPVWREWTNRSKMEEDGAGRKQGTLIQHSCMTSCSVSIMLILSNRHIYHLRTFVKIFKKKKKSS